VKMNKILIAMMVMALLTCVPTQAVTPTETDDLPNAGTLPGNAFYFMKELGEGFGTFFTFGDQARAERHLYLSEVRLAEANALAANGDESSLIWTLNRYEEQIRTAQAHATTAKNNG